ncbi:MAG: hypothetical protein LBO70_03385 [Clostridiales Family XIII bacterium]|jgi:hypothetical protein|nr:hypothetical protein [Clostridiales Family XIII bacterium]
MALLNAIQQMFSDMTRILDIPEDERNLIRKKAEALPLLIQNISAFWERASDKQALTRNDLSKLYEALKTSDAAELAPIDTILAGLSLPEKESDLLSAAELYRWGAELDGFSPRVPGTHSMDVTTAYLTEKLKSFGLETWQEQINFRGVFFREWSFTILTPTERPFICFPQNNVAFGDIESELIYVGGGHEEDYEGKDVRGKIVLLNWGRIWDHEGPCALHERYGLLRLYDIAFARGATGMVGFFEDTPGNTLKLLEPGIKPTGGSNVWGPSEMGPDHQFKLPAVVIGKEDGLELKALLQNGEPTLARLSVYGKRKISTTQSVLGFLPGTGTEAIACAAHSCTAFEGAVCDTVGVVGVLALAKYFASVPLSARPKSILFFMDSFHVWGNCCQTANAILKNHATLADRIEAFLWLDHVSDGNASTGRTMTTSDNPVLWPLATLAMAQRGIRPVSLPVGHIWTTCANGAFERRGIPNLTMQAFGDDVLTTEDTWDKFDEKVLLRDILLYVDIAKALQILSVPENAPKEPVGGCGSLFTETETPSYPLGESYVPEPDYPLYIGGADGPVRILERP